MLAAHITETPRPRPPAKIRRSTSLLKAATTPPPSYAAAFTLTPEGKPRLDTLLGSPMSATFQRVGWDSGAVTRPLSAASEEDMEWVNEKSREELSDLLVKADDLIKERENELGMASVVCKNLYDNNVALKSKHQALLARLPSTSPSPSPEPISRTSSRYSISLNRPISEYDSSPLPYRSHARKISVSTTEISHLADQNAELLDKLERLESESFTADQSGRRVLKRLEKEISTLREELEKTQAKSEELEEKTKASFGWDSEKVVEEIWRKKQAREAKFKAMRGLGQGSTVDEDEGDPEIRNFAPEGSVFGGPTANFSFFPGETPRRPSGTPLNRSAFTPAPLTPHPESSLIAQLLEKIQELEDTNTRIIDQQTETTNQLNAMQRETEHISKVYECFADENIIEVADTDSEGGRSTRDDTIRFLSFRRTLGADFPASPNKDVIRQSLNISTISRARKSVVGLFDSPDDDIRGATTPDQLRAFTLPAPFASSPRSEGHRSSRSVGSTGLASPALSSLSLSSSRSQPLNPLSSSHQTLEAELGDEFSDSWGLGASNNHLRTNSLYDLSPISAPSSPSPLPSRLSHDHSRSSSSSHGPNALPTPMSMGNTALRLSVEPPTPDKVPPGDSYQRGSMGKQSMRYHRMSETVRSRTNRWVDGRFKDTLTGVSKVSVPADDDRKTLSRPLTPLSLRLASAFDAAVLNFAGEDPELSPVSDDQNAARLRANDKVQEKQPRGLGAVMLELWMWLQFAIIIVVFLWAMAKRGPKSVLGEPRQRRTVSSASSSRS